MRLAIVVEGRTEEEFVNGLVAPELRCLGITSQPIVQGSRWTLGCDGDRLKSYTTGRPTIRCMDFALRITSWY